MLAEFEPIWTPVFSEHPNSDHASIRPAVAGGDETLRAAYSQTVTSVAQPAPPAVVNLPAQRGKVGAALTRFERLGNRSESGGHSSGPGALFCHWREHCSHGSRVVNQRRQDQTKLSCDRRSKRFHSSSAGSCSSSRSIQWRPGGRDRFGRTG